MTAKLRNSPLGDIDDLAQWLVDWNDAHGVAEQTRVMKISEEVGEAMQEYFAYRGLNPRKGQTEDQPTSTIKELLDVALAALIAIKTLRPDQDVLDLLETHAVVISRRAELVELPA